MDEMIVKDCNGTILNAGDTVIFNRTMSIKGVQGGIKRGQVVKNIRLTDSDKEIEGKVNGTMLVLKTEFLKKA